MKQFSFFRINRTRTSGMIRTDQIAEFLPSRINPVEGYEGDICIYNKMQPPENFPASSYYDINDLFPFAPWILDHPRIKVITMSRIQHDYVSYVLNRDDIVLIPQHHCNYSRESRDRNEVKVVGLIGGNRSYELDRSKLPDAFKQIGMEYIECIKPTNRQAVVDFYKKIDIQIAFRPNRSLSKEIGKLGTSLKIANGGSFGIPTVTFPEPTYVDEFSGCFLTAYSEGELIKEVKRLKNDPVLYNELSEQLKSKTEKYHIEHIIKLYKQLS